MHPNLITCPSCKHKFSPNEEFSHQIEEQLRKQLEEENEKRREEDYKDVRDLKKVKLL